MAKSAQAADPGGTAEERAAMTATEATTTGEVAIPGP
jgi:hypothetical protein